MGSTGRRGSDHHGVFVKMGCSFKFTFRPIRERALEKSLGVTNGYAGNMRAEKASVGGSLLHIIFWAMRSSRGKISLLLFNLHCGEGSDAIDSKCSCTCTFSLLRVG